MITVRFQKTKHAVRSTAEARALIPGGSHWDAEEGAFISPSGGRYYAYGDAALLDAVRLDLRART